MMEQLNEIISIKTGKLRANFLNIIKQLIYIA